VPAPDGGGSCAFPPWSYIIGRVVLSISNNQPLCNAQSRLLAALPPALPAHAVREGGLGLASSVCVPGSCFLQTDCSTLRPRDLSSRRAAAPLPQPQWTDPLCFPLQPRAPSDAPAAAPSRPRRGPPLRALGRSWDGASQARFRRRDVHIHRVPYPSSSMRRSGGPPALLYIGTKIEPGPIHTTAPARTPLHGRLLLCQRTPALRHENRAIGAFTGE
jgi:hypothetical protein